MELFLWFGIFIAFILILQGLLFAFFGSIAKYLGKQTRPYSVKRDGKKVLILGDSVIAGTGVSRPEFSLIGRLGTEFDTLSIENKAIVGSGTRELALYLRDHHHSPVDFVIIQIGGIDTLTLRSLKYFARRIEYIVTEAKKISHDNVIICSSGNIGNLPFLFFPFNSFFENRTRKIREIFLRITREQNTSYVDFFEERETDPFRKHPCRFFSPDGIHPNDEGCHLWYVRLREVFLRISTEKGTSEKI